MRDDQIPWDSMHDCVHCMKYYSKQKQVYTRVEKLSSYMHNLSKILV